MGIYKRGNICYVRFQVNGKIFNFSAGTTDEEEARKLEKVIKKREQDKIRGIVEDMPLADAIAIFVRHMNDGRTKYKQSSITRYKTSFKQIACYLSDEMLSSVDKDWVAGYVAYRRAEKEEISNRTLRRDLDALSLVFQHMKDEHGAIEHNPVRKYDVNKCLQTAKVEIRIPSHSEIQMIIDDIGPMLGRLTAFQALTGLRQQEALQLEWRDVLLDRGRIIIPKSKSSSPRTVFLFKSAKKILQDLPRSPKGDFVFWHGDGHRYKRFANQWKSFTKRLGLPVRDHDLRHFYAHLYLMKGGTLHGLKEQLGHKWFETTLQYAHLSNEHIESEMERMGEYQPDKKPNVDVKFEFPKKWKYKQQYHPGWPK
ncbi:site-specific integrase [Magnetovibrio sp. PR-2]|uniref:tyrosine-type recombinase/integrase n=1 Tax=Magnetovibrio sp. PR-2 TaxID=3120356 RepID=UPI002FCE2990